MLWFITPLVVLTVISTVIHEISRRRAVAAQTRYTR
jgi:hypothetical protein